MEQFKARIISNYRVAADHYKLSFKAPLIARRTIPGQFFNIKVSDSCYPLLRRPFGAHKIAKDRIEILYKVVGKGTEILSLKKKGEILDILGPLGNGFKIESSTVHRPPSIVLIAGGHGVAPLVALAEKLITYNLKLKTFIGARTGRYIVCDKEFRKLTAEVFITTDDGSKGYKGFVTGLLSRELKTYNTKPKTVIYACGPKPMLKEIARLAKKHRIPCQVSLEEYIGCGFGACLGCVVKTYRGYKLVCKDGPIFDAREIVW